MGVGGKEKLGVQFYYIACSQDRLPQKGSSLIILKEANVTGAKNLFVFEDGAILFFRPTVFPFISV